MNKMLVSSLVVLVALSANVVFAQGYIFSAPTYNPYNYGTNYQLPYSYNTSSATAYAGALPAQVGCVNLTSDLSFGSKGSQVSQLQAFLVSQNFPGGGSWMITGNFRSATLAATRNFQQQQGLVITGVVDAAMRAAIYRVSCSGVLPYNTNYTTYPTYPQNNNCSAYSYQYVHRNCCPTFQNQAPYVQGLGYVFGNQEQNQYQYGNQYCPPSTHGNVVLLSISPTSGRVGTQAILTGSGFTPLDNTVHFGIGGTQHLPSQNGTTMYYTIPSFVSACDLIGYGCAAPAQLVSAGSYQIYVTSGNGTSQALSFQVQ